MTRTTTRLLLAGSLVVFAVTLALLLPSKPIMTSAPNPVACAQSDTNRFACLPAMQIGTDQRVFARVAIGGTGIILALLVLALAGGPGVSRPPHLVDSADSPS